MQIYRDYIDDLCARLKPFGICTYDSNGEFLGFKNIADKINEAYRLSHDDDVDKNLINLLHEVCNSII